MIFPQYSYKQKLYGLALVFLLLCGAAYKRSFRVLIDVWKQHREIVEKVESMNTQPSNIGKIERELAAMNRFFGQNGPDKETVQHKIVDFASSQGLETSIYNLQPIHEYKDKDFHVITNQLDVTGSYNALARLAYLFEKSFQSSRLVGLELYATKKNENPETLHLKMTFQNYESQK